MRHKYMFYGKLEYDGAKRLHQPFQHPLLILFPTSFDLINGRSNRLRDDFCCELKNFSRATTQYQHNVNFFNYIFTRFFCSLRVSSTATQAASSDYKNGGRASD
jgi:hypothetical protein